MVEVNIKTSEKTEARPKSGDVSNRNDDGKRPMRRQFMPRRNRKHGKERFKPEFDQKILGIRRVTRVMAGGRRFSFSVTLVAGDRKGRVGVGIGKGGDTAVAIEKAFNNAKKNMLTLNLTKNMSIPHKTEAKFGSSQLLIFPAPGKGLIAGSAVRSVLELGGVRDVSAKVLSRSKNPLNNSRACVKALSRLLAENPRDISKKDKRHDGKVSSKEKKGPEGIE